MGVFSLWSFVGMRTSWICTKWLWPLDTIDEEQFPFIGRSRRERESRLLIVAVAARDFLPWLGEHRSLIEALEIDLRNVDGSPVS
jgi:hypothetical protein